MNRLNESGMTLIEVLAGVTVAAIFSASIYGVFVSGLSLYEKTSSLGQARDETDYLATMIMNEMYIQKPDFVIPYEDGEKSGVMLRRFSEKEVENYLIEQPDTSDDTYIYFEQNRIVFDTITADEKTSGSPEAGTSPELVLTGETIVLQPADSYIRMRCQADCSEGLPSGIIELNLSILPGNSRVAETMDPIQLRSDFGY
ncbi:PilW family protein [Jeotgalibacillus salarius]|uniref:Prepilin-type N-terminal cleavage/methylation domain-containing protein n=1 Tax=Jeotgalibacillus salarius TaxID=546023 RepID=A0A4Y8LE57_9BACL|nr:prepilin-type N-terminal cleavage/methylation domain-containing protein [Jeotgalibacillus salarius]TFE01011.1 prepilin-type N-terminal cleavage/methylation domain-containing protein [Jeotgalibacillus salarius]